jgi:hypothetical protein
MVHLSNDKICTEGFNPIHELEQRLLD